MMIRQKRNRIDRLQSENGEWVEDQNKLKELTVQYFQNLFSEDVGLNLGIPHRAQFPSLELNIIRDTFRRVSATDIKNAIFDMGSLKAPGIDRLPAGFFQKHGRQ